jgi:lipid-binding SYLF domain-containing protein
MGVSVIAGLLHDALNRGAGNCGSQEVEHHVNTATEVFESMLKTDLPPEKHAMIEKLLKDAHGFAVFPNVQKLGMGISSIQGMGVLAYRHQDGSWSPPIPLMVQGVSTGPHFGLIS